MRESKAACSEVAMWVAARAMIAQRRVYFFALFECATAGAGPAVLGCSPSSHAVIPAISRKAMSAMVATATAVNALAFQRDRIAGRICAQTK